jgi:hypothetical protein
MLKSALTIMLLASTAALAQEPPKPAAAPVIDPSPALSVLQADFTRVTQDINAVLVENQNKVTALQKQLDDLKVYWAAYIGGHDAAADIKPK